ncbi:MAG: 30S ribosomal protein S3 [Coxiella endosymbiont of Dermacentor silvarum]
MGQKVNPVGIRLGVTRDWTSNWYADKKDFADHLNDDLKVRQFLEERLKGAAISRIQIERPARNAKIAIYSARPGVIIGKKGGEIEALRVEISKVIKVPVHITIEEIRKPELDAKLVAESVAQQLERRVMFRRAMKRAVQNTLRQGALGIKISVSGRLGGAEIARTEWYREGRVPLHTFRADIDYATATAKTTYGTIGVKVWIFKGEIHAMRAKTSTAEATVERVVVEEVK